MSDWLEDDVLLKGMLTIAVRRRNGRPVSNQRVTIRGCGFV